MNGKKAKEVRRLARETADKMEKPLTPTGMRVFTQAVKAGYKRWVQNGRKNSPC